MGNKDSKLDCLDADTAKNERVFNAISSGKMVVTRQDLEKSWLRKIDENLCTIILDYLFAESKLLRFPAYNNFTTIILKGTYNDKAELLLNMLTFIQSEKGSQLFQLLLAIVMNYTLLEKQFKNFQLWAGTSNILNQEDFHRIVKFMHRLADGGNDIGKVEYTISDICTLLTVLDRLLPLVFNTLFEVDTTPTTVFPVWQHLHSDVGRSLASCSILQLEDILFLNVSLPIDWQMEWRLLFSTKIHGESFSRLTGQIVNQGPTLLIIRDKDGCTFGGFSPSNWSLGPNFAGDSSSFLFTLTPDMNIFLATNFNDNFQYLNQGQQTLPNGLGMGGRLEYFGLWLDSEFGKGLCNDSCTTYRNFKRLSKQKEFVCAEVEVWGVGQPPPTAAELGERSVLDGNTEAKALLEMAGKKTYSEGLRDEPK